MAVQCARCGAQNPDGNLYCQSCGSPLTAAAGAPPPAPPAPPAPGPSAAPPQGGFAPPPPGVFAPPPPGIAPPTLGQAGYQSPYYAPTGPAAPMHRTPWMLIIAAVVAVVVLMAGFGTAFAVLANRGGNGNNANTTVGDLPSPSPFGTPSPIASATPTPNATGGAESNAGLTVPVPSGWTVESKDSESIVLTDPTGEGSVSLGSGPSVPAQTAQQNKTTIDGYFKSKYPDARDCPNTSVKSTTFNGASGLSWTVCFTLTSGSTAVPAAGSVFVGANKSGSVYYIVMVLTRQDNLQNYLTLAKPVLQGVVWKLS